MTATAASPLAALELLAPRIEQTRVASAARRQLPDELARSMAEAGLFALLVPRALGGLELDPLTAAEVVEAASRIDGSAGWAVMIGTQSAWFASFLPPPVAERVVGRPGATLAGVLRPGGRAVPVDGGYRVSGRWGFASGCTYADHLYGTCVVERPDRPRTIRLVYMPAAEATVLDTWRSVGLRATGSHDFTLQDIAVDGGWTLPMPVLCPAPHDGPLYRDGYQNLVFVLQAAQALGVARGALVAFTELAGGTARWLSGAPLRDRPMVQVTAARAEAKIASARAWLREAVAEVWDTVLAGDPPQPQQRIRVRLAITHGISTAVAVADVLQRVAGTVAVTEDHPLQRAFQDLRTAAAHVQAAPSIFELTGGLLLGADVPPSVLL